MVNVSISGGGSDNSEVATVDCYLRSGGQNLASASQAPADSAVGGGYIAIGSLAMTATYAAPGASTVQVECDQFGTDSVDLGGSLTMIKVGSIE